MQPLLEVWYIASRLGEALLFNPPGLTGWAAWFTTIIRTVVVIVLFRRNLAPFILARISRHVRARSISIRSIRGLYVCGMGRTWKAERISWSFHPWAHSGMSIRVEGLHVMIAQTNPTPYHRIVKQTARAKSFAVLSNVIVTILAPLTWFIKWSRLKRSLGYLRRILYSTSITTSQLLIQYLPSLTQNIDFEVDSISISFQDLAHAQVVLKYILIGIKLDLSQMGRSLEQHLSNGFQENTNDFAEASTWNVRFRTNAERFWEHIWGQTEILTMLNVSIHDIVGRLGPKTANIFEDRVFETQAASQGNSDIFVHVPATLQLSLSLQFSPRLRTFMQNTLKFSLDLQEVEIYAENLKQLVSQEEQGLESSENILVSTPSTSPSLIYPTSPVSPFISAFSQIGRRQGFVAVAAPPIQRIREPKLHSLCMVLKSADVQFASIKVVYSSPSGMLNSHAHVLTTNQVMIHLGPTAGTNNVLHNKWFGSKPFTPLDVPVYGLTCSIGDASINRIRNTISGPLVSSLFLLEGLQLGVIAHQWPPTLIRVSSSFLAEGPNASFLAAEMHISTVHVSDQVEELKVIIDSLLPSNPGKRTASSSSYPMQCIPQIHFECLCESLHFYLVVVSETVNAVFSLNVPGANCIMSTSFPTSGGVPNSDILLHMNTNFRMFFGPILLRAGVNHEHGLDVDTLGRCWEGLEDLLVIDAMDVTVDNQTKALFIEGSGVMIEPSTSFSDVRLVVDVVSIEVWNAIIISAIGAFLEATRSGKDESPPSSLSLFNRLPSGFSFHFAIACFTIVITSPDLNPECNLGLARGLQLRSGITVKYCRNGSSTHDQVKDEKLLQNLRNNLYASESHSLHAMSLASTEFPQDMSALIRIFLWDTVCHNALSTLFEVGSSSRNGNVHPFLAIPRITMSAQLRDMIPLSPKAHSSIDVSLHISHIRGHLDLLNVYSTLLMWQTLRSWIVRRSNRLGVQGSRNVGLSLAIQIANIHILCHFPLEEQLFIQVAAFSAHRSPSESLVNNYGSVVAYVRSAQVTNEWEELLRLQHVSYKSTEQPHSTNREISLQGLRLAIPYDYVLSELILNAVVAVKAIRHLYCIVQLGKYTPFPAPTAEGPKQTPVIDINIHTVTVEAADSPFEAKLALIWRTGTQAQRIRIERELAFEAKLRAIMASGEVEEIFDFSPQSDLRYHFTSRRTTSVSDARERLNMIHSTSWINVITHQKGAISRKEENILKNMYQSANTEVPIPLPIVIHVVEKAPPLVRASLTGVRLSLSVPYFSSGYAGFLQELGDLPRQTEYSLLVPLQVRCTLDAMMISIRDYYLPLLNVPFSTTGPSLVFETTLIVAEEMGSRDSVEWLRCPVVPDDAGIVGARAFCLSVPKTIMPVKSYASPLIKFCTTAVTEFTWGVSYNPAVQEIMRVIETFSHPSRDPSPSIGFWDKLRLVFHWRIKATFEGGAQLHFKGSRDPHHVTDIGAGFDFRWDGHVSLQIACQNDEMELIQLTSDSMMITIPDYGATLGSATDTTDMSGRKGDSSFQHEVNDRKICAKFSNGIRWGIGVSLERTCDNSCITCHGDSFNRRCRFFSFVPHYKVVLHTPSATATRLGDSYAGFRSNFIHFSTSLTSPLKIGSDDTNSFHLTPKTFAHFWSWWHLFDGALSLPIRQGSLFPNSRPPTKKFGRHLATIKYRISFSSIYIAHVYKIDSTADWAAGESHCVGVKAFLEDFQADLHQREEEITTYKRHTQESKTIRHKSFSAVDVVLSGLDLRTIFAIFAEPEKCSIPMQDSTPNPMKFWETLKPVSLSSAWMDADDFVELDWVAVDSEPILYVHQSAVCPRFMYFKRTPRSSSVKDDENISHSKTKFGDEATHICLMGKQQSGHDVQVQFAANRLAELRRQLDDSAGSQQSSRNQQLNDADKESRPGTETNIAQMILLVERYMQQLSELHNSPIAATSENQSSDLYAMPADIMLPQEVNEFANVYQVHCPKIHLNNATRDILQQYYIASRARRGFEYHMSARAVKFIRDQALSIHSDLAEEQETVKRRPRAGSAHAAAQAVRRILTGDERHKADGTRNDKNHAQKLTEGDPLYGWDQGVLERKAHLCVFLKPQIVVHSHRHERSTLVLVSDHVVLRNYGILDKANADDPVSGYVMQRNYASIDSLQVFQPTNGSVANHLPLEVFLDVRCESRDFERLVPQTRATLRYDKFNRLRLRNDVTTVAISAKNGGRVMVDHLLHDMDLIGIAVPRFSISADAAGFAAMADIVTDLLLFSDPVHKARMTQLETMLFSYDFTDLRSAAQVVSDLQARLRRLLCLEETYGFHQTSDDQYALIASKAHIFRLSQELNLIFDAIRLAQVKTDDRSQDKKSALSLQFSSSEISWLMLDDNKKLLAKLAVRGINYSWLSRQDGSTASFLSAADLQAFDGSPKALWPEILAKYDEPPGHHMIRRGLFVEAQWSILAPVGGISIYDHFKMQLHPIRLALETKLGNKLVEYLIPGRRSRREEAPQLNLNAGGVSHHSDHRPIYSRRTSDGGDVNSLPQLAVHPPQEAVLHSMNPAVLPEAAPRRPRLVASRSFSNLKSDTADFGNTSYHTPRLPRSSSSVALVTPRDSFESDDNRTSDSVLTLGVVPKKGEGDASEMRHRSAQKTFVHVEIPSVHVLLSVMKGRGFLVRDARLRTHDLEWRNRTSSFEELFSQFIPSDPSLRGWIKVAWQQPVFSVGGVVKELITKTQWGRLGKQSDIDAPTLVRRKSDRSSTHTAPGAQSESVSLSPHRFPETSVSASNDAEEMRSRQRSSSRPRVSSLFRRSESRKRNIDVGYSTATPST